MKIPPTLTSGREPNNNNNKPYVSTEKVQIVLPILTNRQKLNPKL